MWTRKQCPRFRVDYTAGNPSCYDPSIYRRSKAKQNHPRQCPVTIPRQGGPRAKCVGSWGDKRSETDWSMQHRSCGETLYWRERARPKGHAYNKCSHSRTGRSKQARGVEGRLSNCLGKRASHRNEDAWHLQDGGPCRWAYLRRDWGGRSWRRANWSWQAHRKMAGLLTAQASRQTCDRGDDIERFPHDEASAELETRRGGKTIDARPRVVK